MGGNFKFYCFLLLLSIVSCKKEVLSKNVGQHIIENNIPLFIDELHWSTIEKERDNRILVMISDQVTDNSLFLEECDCFDIFNKEGFDINDDTKFEEFNINSPSLSISNKDVRFFRSEPKTNVNNYVEVFFNNFYLNKEKNKSFVIVEKIGRGIKSWTKEVYFFSKVNDNWKFEKKELLISG